MTVRQDHLAEPTVVRARRAATARRPQADQPTGTSAAVGGGSLVAVPTLREESQRSPTASGPSPGDANPDSAQPSPTATLTLPPGDSLEATRTVMRAIEELAPLPDGTYATTYRGQRLVLSAAQAEQARATAASSLQTVLQRSRDRFDRAAERYEDQRSTDKEFWFTSRAVKAAAWIRTLGAHSDPGMAITLQRTGLELSSAQAERLIQSGQFSKAAGEVAQADAVSETTERLVHVYVEQIIDSAEGVQSGLEYTRNSAFISLGVLAVVVTGGAAAGAAPAVIGGGVGGLSAGATATAISVTAPIVANVGVGLAKVSLGETVDWGSIAVDAAVQILLARFGGKLSEKIYGKLAGNPATQTLARKAMASVVSGVATHEVGQAFSTAAAHTYDGLRGRPVTWGRFVDDLVDRLTDPTGLFLAVAMSSLQFGAHVAVDRHTSAQGTKARPAAEPTPIKSATESTPIKPPTESASTKPATTPSQQAAAPPAAGAVNAPPQSPRPPVTAEQRADNLRAMLAQRRQQTIDALADTPALQAAVASAKQVRGVGDLAEIPPTVLRRTWAEYQLNAAARVAKGQAPHEFGTYVRMRQGSDRGSLGEMTDVFVRGPREVIVQAPGRINEPGIDTVSFAPGPNGGRIKLLDNKAHRRTVREVSALQENLAARPASVLGPARKGNLAETIDIVRQAAVVPGAARELSATILPRLTAASKAIDAHVDTWVKANPGRDLNDPKLQTEIGKILDQHGIDRVITTEAGRPGIGLTKRLEDQGFLQE